MSDVALNLAGSCYRDPALFEREQSEIFGTMWLPVCRSSEVGEKGDYRAFTLGRDPIVVTHDGAGVRGHYNVCRHRGSCLVEDGGGRLDDLVCPYHAWRYSLSGDLQVAPKMDAVEGFDRGDFSLSPVRVGSWQGFEMICLDEGAPPLREALSDVPAMEPWSLPDLEVVESHSYEVAANWKVLVENYSECYHCARVHPHLHRISDGGGPRASRRRRAFNGGPMNLGDGFDDDVDEGPESVRSACPACTARIVASCTTTTSIPICCSPCIRTTFWFIPCGRWRSTGSRVDCAWLFHPSQIPWRDFDPSRCR